MPVVDMMKLQKAIYQNKLDHNFNVTDIPKEFMYLQCELSEAYMSYLRYAGEGLAEELADVAIYLLGLSEILGVDLEAEILKKMEKNRRRVYVVEDGVVKKIENAID